MNIVGGKSDDGGTQGNYNNSPLIYAYETNSGKLLTVLLTWLLLSPAFRLRKFFQGNKQGGLSPGGLALTLSIFFGLLRNVILSVALGYHSVFLCIAPQLLTALILLISKCIADKEFRRWSLGDQVMYALIGSLVPSITPRSSAEDISGNDEDQNESHLIRAHVADTMKAETDKPPAPSAAPNQIDATPTHVETDAGTPNATDAPPMQVETDADLDEPNSCDIAGGEAEGSYELNVTRRSTSKELVALFIIHAVSVILGAALFAFLHETSTEFVTSEIKVKEASRIDLMLAVYIGSPAALLASFAFRAIHSKLGPWRAINKQPPTCQTFCPPALESREEQIKFTLADDEEEDVKQEESLL